MNVACPFCELGTGQAGDYKNSSRCSRQPTERPPSTRDPEKVMVVFDSWERVARERRIVSFIAMRDVELVRFSVGEGKALAECDLTNCRLAEQPTSARIPGPESQACHGRYLLNPPCGSLTPDGSTPSPPGLISCFPCEKSQNILTRHALSSGGRGRVSSFSPLSRTTHTRPDATRPARHR